MDFFHRCLCPKIICTSHNFCYNSGAPFYSLGLDSWRASSLCLSKLLAFAVLFFFRLLFNYNFNIMVCYVMFLPIKQVMQVPTLFYSSSNSLSSSFFFLLSISLHVCSFSFLDTCDLSKLYVNSSLRWLWIHFKWAQIFQLFQNSLVVSLFLTSFICL